jgi:hypothetical protein
MDLRLFFRVLHRFRFLVLNAVVLAVALSFLSYYRVDFGGGTPSLTPRQHEQWVSYSRLLVTQPGFDWGRSSSDASADGTQAGQSLELQQAAEGRLGSLAIIYAKLIESDAVVRLMQRPKPIFGHVEAAPLPAVEGSSEVVPILSIAAIARTRKDSVVLGDRATNAIRTFLEQQQQVNKIPPKDRVVLTTIMRASDAKLYVPRSKTLPIVVFLTILVCGIGLALVLENVRPRARPGLAPAPNVVAPEPERRTALP